MRSRRASAFVLALAFLSIAALAEAEPRSTPVIAGCPAFPRDNIWNARVDALPVDPRSDQYVASIGADASLKPDFGAGLWEGRPMGIPWVSVSPDQPDVPIHFAPFGDETEAAGDESDPGPYPIPKDAPIEGGPEATDDRHVIIVQEDICTLYELYKAAPNADGSWNAVSGARFDLRNNDLRPEQWTSADAAGLPILPGLVRYEEVEAGEIAHALRFTARQTRRAYVWPARHFASQESDPTLPSMGQRFRLKASVDISGFSRANQVILRALQTYGMILADNGSPWFLSGAPHYAWNNDELNDELRKLKGSDFEAVDVSSLMRDPNSAEAVAP
jgi:hypothetical protein